MLASHDACYFLYLIYMYIYGVEGENERRVQMDPDAKPYSYFDKILELGLKPLSNKPKLCFQATKQLVLFVNVAHIVYCIVLLCGLTPFSGHMKT